MKNKFDNKKIILDIIQENYDSLSTFYNILSESRIKALENIIKDLERKEEKIKILNKKLKKYKKVLLSTEEELFNYTSREDIGFSKFEPTVI